MLTNIKCNTDIYFYSNMFNDIANILFSLKLYCKLNKYFVL